MGAPVPNDARLKGPFKPMRFEATVEDCVVSHGEIPKELHGGFYRVGPTWKRPTLQGSERPAVDGRHGSGPRARQRPRRLPQPLDPDAEVPARGEVRARHVRVVRRRVARTGATSVGATSSATPRTAGSRRARTRSTPSRSPARSSRPASRADRRSRSIRSRSRPRASCAGQTSSRTASTSPAGHANGNGEGIVGPDADPDAVFAAHPKWDSETGELFGFAFSDEPPYATVHIVSVDGNVTSLPLHDAPYHCNVHDIWVTHGSHRDALPAVHLDPEADRAGISACSAGTPSCRSPWR